MSDPFNFLPRLTRLSRRKGAKAPVSLYDKLKNMKVDARHPIEAEGWDSQFFQKPFHDMKFKFQDRIAKGSEVNYFAMGMLMKHSGKELYKAINITYNWKTVNIAFGVEGYQFPTDNELFFLALGYYTYDKPCK